MAMLWPALDPEPAAANLRKAVHFARQALGSLESVEAGHDLIQLWPAGELHVDLLAFESAAKSALTTGVGLEAAAALYTGELLPADRYADWTEPRREQARFLCLELCRAGGRWDKVLEIDRADEQAHRALMESYLAAGQRQAVIRQFQRARDALRIDLGVGPDEQTVAVFERALAATGPEAPSLGEQAQNLIARGLLAWNQRQLEEAGRLAQKARELATGGGLARELGEASVLLCLVAFAQGRWQERFRADFEEALRLDPAESAQVFDSHLCFAETSLGSADTEAVVSLARELLPRAEQAGSLQGAGLAMLLLGEAGLAAGRLEDAERRLSAASRLFTKIGSQSGLVLATVRLAEIEAYRGHARAAVELLSRMRDPASSAHLAPHLVVRVFSGLLEALTDQEERLTLLDEAELALRPGDVCPPCSIGFRLNAVRACAEAGELPRARRCLEEAEAIAGMWQGGPWRAASWVARAAVRRAEGDLGQSAALLREAAEVFDECGRPLDAEHCRRAVATASVSRG